jgi:hypothetical protein
MARPALHKIFVVVFDKSSFALVSAHDVICEEPFTQFVAKNKATVQAIRTDRIVSITSTYMTLAEVRGHFPAKSIYVELKGTPKLALLPAP